MTRDGGGTGWSGVVGWGGSVVGIELKMIYHGSRGRILFSILFLKINEYLADLRTPDTIKETLSRDEYIFAMSKKHNQYFLHVG